MSNFQFQKLKKKNPLWKDMLSFCLMVMGVWGGTHLAMNYSAYAEIAGFQYKNFQASVIKDIGEMKIQEGNKETLLLKNMPLKKKVRRPMKKVGDLNKVSEKRLSKVRKEKITFRQTNLKPRNQAKTVFDKMPIYPSDNRLVIPRIGKNVPLIKVPNHRTWKQLESTIQKGLRNGVVVHPVSHDPGNFGNFFLTGHSSYYAWDKGRFKDVFALLHEVNPGDLVEVYWEGKKYVYKIKEKKVVKPTAVEILKQPKNKKEITLMTCTPVGTNTNRLILVGELKEER